MSVKAALLGEAPWLAFFFALGACVGSFVNVLVYRLPRGMGVVTPPSRCPACETRLTWRENIPIFGWLLLRGRCRFCRSPISLRYPLVELFCALLFLALYALWYADPTLLQAVGLDDPQALRPAWTQAGLAWTWPSFVLILALLAGLLAMTLVDAATFTIPLIIPWTIGALALLAHPLHALVVELRAGELTTLAPTLAPWRWVIPTASWDFSAAALAGGAGLVLAVALLEKGLIPRSFADYDAWERGQRERDDPPPSDSPHSGRLHPLLGGLLIAAPGLAGMFLGFSVGLGQDRPLPAAALGTALGLLAGLVLRRLLGAFSGGADDPLWTRYPHARREALKELLFLAPPALLAAGAFAAVRLAGWGDAQPPLWLAALAGSLLGLLGAGALVWAARILGTLAFGKEAMGLGDVHLLAAVGACLGWIDPLLAFFLAPFFGLAWALGSLAAATLFRREGAALPYGPHLALATALVVVAKPLFAHGLSLLLGTEIRLP